MAKTKNPNESSLNLSIADCTKRKTNGACDDT